MPPQPAPPPLPTWTSGRPPLLLATQQARMLTLFPGNVLVDARWAMALWSGAHQRLVGRPGWLVGRQCEVMQLRRVNAGRQLVFLGYGNVGAGGGGGTCA